MGKKGSNCTHRLFFFIHDWLKKLFWNNLRYTAHFLRNFRLSFPIMTWDFFSLTYKRYKCPWATVTPLCVCLHPCSWMKPARQRAAPLTSSQMWRRWWWWRRWRSTWSQSLAGQMVRPLLPVQWFPPLHSTGMPMGSMKLIVQFILMDHSPMETPVYQSVCELVQPIYN